MRKITLKRISYKNFRGQSRDVEFSPGLTEIFGRNGMGKTTVLEVFLWVLTRADSLNRVNYDLFDNKMEYSPEAANVILEAEVFLDVDGVETSLKRTAWQKWVRKRNSAEYTKSETDGYGYYMDGLEVASSMYNVRIQEIFGCDIDKLKLILNIRHFRSLHWTDLRTHFADLVGEIAESEYKGDYSSIKEELDRRGSAATKAYFKQQIKPLKEQQEEIDADIKAEQRHLPDPSMAEAAEKEIEEKRKRIAEINREILGLQEANRPLVEKRRAHLALIDDKERELVREMHNHNDAITETRRKLESELAEINSYNKGLASERSKRDKAIFDIKKRISDTERDIAYAEEELVRMRAKRDALRAKAFDGTCPTCGNRYPDALYAQESAKFVAAKEADLANIISEGQRKAAHKAVLVKRLEEAKEELARIESEPIAESKSTAEAEAMLSTYISSVVPFAETDKCKALKAEIDVLRIDIPEIPEVDSKALTDEQAALVDDIENLSKIAATRKEHDKGIALIKQYEQDKLCVGGELAKWEGLLSTLMEREREWASIVRTKANRYLELVKVEMLDRDKGGNFVDICSVSIDGVDVGVTNTANKVLAGIDISRAFAKAYGIEVPMFIDNAEQITESSYIKEGSQIVTLNASKEYDTLTILNK